VADEKTIEVKIGTSSQSDEEKASSISSVAEHPPFQPMVVDGQQAPETEGGDDTQGKDPLTQAQREVEENRDRWMRAVADLENYKKRAATERSKLQKYRYEELLRDLLPILDNLDRAIVHCSQASHAEGIADGICMIAGMFRDTLDRYGVKEIQSTGEPFDPRFHEAIAQAPSTDGRTNIVVEELEKGYLYHDKLLRPARVVVSTEQRTVTDS